MYLIMLSTPENFIYITEYTLTYFFWNEVAYRTVRIEASQGDMYDFSVTILSLVSSMLHYISIE